MLLDELGHNRVDVGAKRPSSVEEGDGEVDVSEQAFVVRLALPVSAELVV